MHVNYGVKRSFEVCDARSFLLLLMLSGGMPEWDSNPDLCYSGALSPLDLS